MQRGGPVRGRTQTKEPEEFEFVGGLLRRRKIFRVRTHKLSGEISSGSHGVEGCARQ